MNAARSIRIATTRNATRLDTPAILFWLKRAARKQGRSALELKVPPVALSLIAAALMWSASLAAPSLDFTLWTTYASSVSLALMGVLTCLASVVSFRRAKTTVNPTKPDATTSLVVSGIYSHTRNPMYLGFLLILLGWAVFLSNPLALVVLPGFVLYLNRIQILPEECVLALRFGDNYADYCSRVRPWL
jgi:protein-S-isoprenylcysteine O-methyltransferase Ste14